MHGISTRARVGAAGVIVFALATPLTAAMATSASAATVSSTAVAPSAYSSKATFHRTLSLGKRGADVKRVQKLAMVKQTAVYDVRTLRKVQKIQRTAHLRPTGKVTAGKTYTAIVRYYKAQTRAKVFKIRTAKILKMAAKYKGRPYRYGAGGPRAFDCSGYTRYVVKKALGKSLPHQSGQQYSKLKKVSRANAKPGDLIFFRKGGHIYHVGIYAGGGKLWHASRPGTSSGKGKIFSSNVTFARVA